jgi:hypothetical protein
MFLINKVIKFIDVQIRIKLIPRFVDGNIFATKFLVNKFSKKPVLVLPELFEKNSFFRKRNAKKNLNIKNKIKILYNGNPGKTKDRLDICIEILSEINYDFLFTIAGITESYFLKNWPKSILFLNKIRSKVLFLGKVDHEESIKLLNESDYLFFYRNKSNLTSVGFPRKVAEASLLCIPVITTKTSDLDLYLNDKVDSVFIPFEINQAILKIQNIFEKGKSFSQSLSNNLFLKPKLEISTKVIEFSNFLDIL